MKRTFVAALSAASLFTTAAYPEEKEPLAIFEIGAAANWTAPNLSSAGPFKFDCVREIEWLLAAGLNPRVSQVAPEMVAAANLVAAGLGFTIVPQSLQRMKIEGVIYRDFRGAPQPTAPLNLATRRNDPSAVVRNFLSLAKRTAWGF